MAPFLSHQVRSDFHLAPKPLALAKWFLNYRGSCGAQLAPAVHFDPLLVIHAAAWPLRAVQVDLAGQIYLRNIALTWLVYGATISFSTFQD